MKLDKFFYYSLLGGIFMWFIILFIIPVDVNKISKSTVLFIVFSYVLMIFGYIISFRKLKTFQQSTTNYPNIKILIGVLIVAFIVRYIDLFIFRELRFSNSISHNKYLASISDFNVFFAIATVIKEMYFIPLILVLHRKSSNKLFITLALLLFVLPIPESILRGSRRVIFQVVLLLVFIVLFIKENRINYKSIIIIGITGISLFITSTYLLFERETGKSNNVYIHLIRDARYNELLMPSKGIVNYIADSTNSNNAKKLIISSMQIGQYYTHGVFEFDYVMNHYKNNEFKKQNGKFTFFVIPKFLDKIGFETYNLEDIYKISPRVYTFISFFGGMYLDFGWFALPLFFIFGLVQKRLFIAVSNNEIIYYPFFIFLLFTNFFMLTFNFFRGIGTYTLISCIAFIMIFEIILKRKR